MRVLIVFLILVLCFSCKEKKEDVIEVEYDIKIDTLTTINKEDELVKQKLQELKERFYHIKLYNSEIVTDTIVGFDFLESDSSLDYSFDYEPFLKRGNSDSISLYTKNIEVVIRKSKFEKTKSKLTYDSDSLNIIQIDNHNVIGAEDVPNTYISKIYLDLSNNYVEIDKRYYEDLYEPNFDLTEAYYYDKEIIITMGNSDGYLGYVVTFFIDEELNIKRIIYIP
ncbi:hypothetical protein [Winogradskyella thalassocola]|uniref:Uncharacterized protein n=1 Tax=Winogradskyella thalassocola TaxID=262004 RepID=A0A1G8IP86_9FLAO|nr:hypothetical protein [Winogradskyella thalassocola]SDI20735.1 hypothetical protein SAMN04489796_10833 [Winogradskyella thalassocola]